MFNKANTAHHAVAYARNFVPSMGPGICCMSCAQQYFFMPYATQVLVVCRALLGGTESLWIVYVESFACLGVFTCARVLLGYL